MGAYKAVTATLYHIIVLIYISFQTCMGSSFKIASSFICILMSDIGLVINSPHSNLIVSNTLLDGSGLFTNHSIVALGSNVNLF